MGCGAPHGGLHRARLFSRLFSPGAVSRTAQVCLADHLVTIRVLEHPWGPT